VILAAVATFGLGFCSTLPFLFTLRFLTGVGKVMMASGVTLLAAQWFRKRFGLALACCYAGWHFGGLVMVPLTQFLIDAVGWREATTVLSFAIVIIALPTLLLWARWPTPIERGLEPETNMPLYVHEQNEHHRSAPLPRVLKHPALWLSIGVTVLGGFAYGALLTNEAALVDEIRPLHGRGSVAVSTTAFAALCGAIGMGWLADKLTFLHVIMLELSLLLCGVLGFLGLYVVSHGSLALMAAVFFGVAVGGFEAAILAHMCRTLQADEFDHAFGVWYCCYLVTLFVGPIGAGWVRDITHSYVPTLVILVTLTAASSVPAGLLAVLSSTPRQTEAK
jgi:MFS family permease